MNLEQHFRDLAAFSRRVDALKWGGPGLPQLTSEWLERFKSMELHEMEFQLQLIEDGSGRSKR